MKNPTQNLLQLINKTLFLCQENIYILQCEKINKVQ
jgi:hypothetical protein